MLLRMKIPLSAVRLFSPSLGFTPAWPACGCPKSLQALLSVPGHHLINWLHIPACDLECFRSLLGRCVRFRKQAARSTVCIPASISELTFIAPLCGSLIDSIHCCLCFVGLLRSFIEKPLELLNRVFSPCWLRSSRNGLSTDAGDRRRAGVAFPVK